jgi:heptosyltransferase-2
VSHTLIVRLPNWLGDTVMAVPALRALRNGWPDARLALAGPWVSLLAGQGLADVLVVYPRSWSARIRQADALRALGAQTAILLPNSLEAAAAARYWGARRRVGFAVGGRRWLLTDALALPDPRRHQVDEYLVLVEHLGVTRLAVEPRLERPDADGAERVTLRALLREIGAPAASPSTRLIGVHLGAAFGPSKLWPASHIAELCRRLAREGSVPLLLGTADDAKVAAAVRQQSSALSLVGRDRPELLAALLSELSVLVCGDTGVGHLAAALGTPVVTLFGPTDWRLTAPRGRVEIMQHPTPCAPCFHRACPIDHPCMRGIAADEVWAGVSRLTA